MSTTPQTELPPEDALQAFRDRLRGGVLHPEDAGYDEARTVWNGMIDRYPQDGETGAAYRENYDRLVDLKSEWDPENRFRFNQNIEPAN